MFLVLSLALAGTISVSADCLKRPVKSKAFDPSIWCETIPGCGGGDFVACGASQEEIYNVGKAFIDVECAW